TAPGQTRYVSIRNSFHHNTLIWDGGDTGHAGYTLTDPTDQPNFFANNTAPDYNAYHTATPAATSFLYDNNSSGANTPKTCTQLQSAFADVHGTIDSINASGFPAVAITSPTDQSSPVNTITVTGTASD